MSEAEIDDPFIARMLSTVEAANAEAANAEAANDPPRPAEPLIPDCVAVAVDLIGPMSPSDITYLVRELQRRHPEIAKRLYEASMSHADRSNRQAIGYARVAYDGINQTTAGAVRSVERIARGRYRVILLQLDIYYATLDVSPQRRTVDGTISTDVIGFWSSVLDASAIDVTITCGIGPIDADFILHIYA